MGIIFNHVLIDVKDLEQSIEFYKIIGFTHKKTVQYSADVQVGVMQLGQTSIEIRYSHKEKMTVAPPRKSTDVGFRHIGIAVDDVNKVYEQLKEKIQFRSPPREVKGRPGRFNLFFKDPDGVELHFVQE